MKYWLITYQVSRNARMSWEVWNLSTHLSPADWLNEISRKKSQWGYTNVVLLNALEITPAEYERLQNNPEVEQ